MDKNALLETVKELASEGGLSEVELLQAFRDGAGGRDVVGAHRMSHYSKVLYFVGGGVVVVGIVALIAQIWDELGSVMHVVVTLGSGLAAYITGVILSRHGRLGAAGAAFFLIAALVLPLGFVVALDEIGLDPEKLVLQSLTSLVFMVVFLLTYLLFRGNSLLLYTIGYGTWFVFAATDWLVGPNPRFADAEFLEYRVLAVGLVYMLLAFAFSETDREPLSGVLYGFGSLGFLGAALALGGWEPSQSVVWELVFPGLVFVVLYASVHLKSKALLTFGSLFLGGYLVKITTEYFSDSLGWPLALVISGLALMGVGYLTLRIKRRYLTGG